MDGPARIWAGPSWFRRESPKDSSNCGDCLIVCRSKIFDAATWGHTDGIGIGGGLTATVNKVKLTKPKAGKPRRATEDSTPGNGGDGEVVLQWRVVPGQQANTGAKTLTLAATGAGLLTLGAILVGAGRRRTRYEV